MVADRAYHGLETEVRNFIMTARGQMTIVELAAGLIERVRRYGQRGIQIANEIFGEIFLGPNYRGADTLGPGLQPHQFLPSPASPRLSSSPRSSGISFI